MGDIALAFGPELLLIALAAGLAGFVDAIVGGGGLVLVPAMFAVYPQAPPATLLGTNKGGAVWGTAWASVQYARRVVLPRHALAWAVPAALGGSFVGAWAVTLVSADGLKRALPFVLAGVLAYTLARKDLGRHHAPRYGGCGEAAIAASLAAVVGFYDGFFGPGTGSFFVFLFVRLLGYDFLHASASAKLLNTATNAAALVLFAAKGHVWWHLALLIALANVAGSLAGTRLALARGAGFVRKVFIGVVAALIAKTAYDAFLR
ncbi:MAG TPA: TSUP family transporter [Burkholderiaceae bacterium]|nr:TSUP family transporter [Burkholderiaceae bacterium]